MKKRRRKKLRLRATIRRLQGRLVAPIGAYRKKLKHYFSLGARGERAAAAYLTRKNYYVWECNVRLTFGELDIVASKARTLIFVEVKTRSKHVAEKFPGIEAVDDHKETRIQQLAAKYIRDNRALLRFRRIRAVRFDVVEVVAQGWPWPMRIIHSHTSNQPIKDRGGKWGKVECLIVEG